jgi:hypothetical protein
MSVSQYQYERLEWLLENKELNLPELKMLDNMIAADVCWHDGALIEWLLQWLRSKPSKKTHGSFAMRTSGCTCPLCDTPWNAP